MYDVMKWFCVAIFLIIVYLGHRINIGSTTCSGGDDEYRPSALEVVIGSICSTFTSDDITVSCK